MCFLNGHTHCQHVIGLAYMPGYTSGTDWPVLTISFNLFTVAFPWILLSVAFAKRRRWHTQICNFRCLITTCVLQVCMDRELINAVVVRWLDGKCQRLLATALKVQHCWTLKTTVGDCWRQSPTCAGDSRQLKYKHARDCRRLSPSRATVGDCRRLKYKPGFTLFPLHTESNHICHKLCRISDWNDPPISIGMLNQYLEVRGWCCGYNR